MGLGEPGRISANGLGLVLWIPMDCPYERDGCYGIPPDSNPNNLPTQTPNSISCIHVGDMSHYYLMLRIIRWFALKLGKG